MTSPRSCPRPRRHEVVWATRPRPRSHCAPRSDGRPFDCILLDGDSARPSSYASSSRKAAASALIVTAAGPDVAAIAARAGATDWVPRPFTAAELAFHVGRSAPHATLRQTPAAQERRPDRRGRWIKELYERIAMVAATDVTVAIFGESGTGKELVARAIHNASPRARRAVRRRQLRRDPRDAARERAVRSRARRVHRRDARPRRPVRSGADGGTLFLDEIGELPLALQAKLLRVLQEQRVPPRRRRRADRRVDVRVVAATNRDLEQLVATRRVPRGPLLPPQRVPAAPAAAARAPRRHPAARAPLRRTSTARGSASRSTASRRRALARLAAYDWPGNVRELENKVHQAMVIAAGRRSSRTTSRSADGDDHALPRRRDPAVSRPEAGDDRCASSAPT